MSEDRPLGTRFTKGKKAGANTIPPLANRCGQIEFFECDSWPDGYDVRVQGQMPDDFKRKRAAAFAMAIARVMGLPNGEIRTMVIGLQDWGSGCIPFADPAGIVAAQRESYDGTGSPRGLKGGQIPLGARILRVADVFDALTAGRAPYRAVSTSEAKEEIQRAAGSRFDPKVVNAFLEIPDGVWADLMQEIPAAEG